MPQLAKKSLKEAAKKLKYLKIPRKPKLITILSQNQILFLDLVFASYILMPLMKSNRVEKSKRNRKRQSQQA
jgi:hypothetical protein